MSDPGGGSGDGPAQPPGRPPWPGQQGGHAPPAQPAPGSARQPPAPYPPAHPQPFSPPHSPPGSPPHPQQGAPPYPQPGAPPYPQQGRPPYPQQGAPPYPQQGAPPAPPQQGAPPYPQQGAPPHPQQGTQAHAARRQPPAPYRREPPPPYPLQPGAPGHGWQGQPQQGWAPAHGQPPQPQAGPPSAAGPFQLALRRAFRLYIDPREVTDAERAALQARMPPITDPEVQGFLAWRRSVHMVVAVAIIPLLIFMVVNLAQSKDTPGAYNALLALQLAVEVGFAILLWTQLRRWTEWQKQRRVLLVGWMAFFLMPFVLYLYPLRSAMEEVMAQGAGNPQAARMGSIMVGMVASVAAMIELTPKAISVMPGLLRGAITSKLLFPGASAPGWLLLLLAPIYALLMYVVLIIPYQLTGSGFFVPAMIGLIGAQVWLGRMGYQMARPEQIDEALALVRKVRATYVALSVLGLAFAALGVMDLLRQLQLPIWRGVQILLSLVVNVLLLTLIATDQIVANLVRGQRLVTLPGTREAQAAFVNDIAHFEDPPPATDPAAAQRTGAG
jgi:hypothetical protein